MLTTDGTGDALWDGFDARAAGRQAGILMPAVSKQCICNTYIFSRLRTPLFEVCIRLKMMSDGCYDTE